MLPNPLQSRYPEEEICVEMMVIFKKTSAVKVKGQISDDAIVKQIFKGHVLTVYQVSCFYSPRNCEAAGTCMVAGNCRKKNNKI